MDWLTFIERIAHSLLSWPVAAVVVAVVLRHSLGDLVRNVKRLAMKAGTAEIAFDREVAQVTALVDSTLEKTQERSNLEKPSSQSATDSAVFARLRHLKHHAARLPSGTSSAALLAWDELTWWVFAQLGELPQERPQPASPSFVASVAVSRGLLREERISFLERLDEFFNQVEVVGREGKLLTEDQANDVIDMVSETLEVMQLAKSSIDHSPQQQTLPQNSAGALASPQR